MEQAMQTFPTMPHPVGMGDTMISVHDPLGMYLYASPESASVLGVEPDALLGNSAAYDIGAHEMATVADAYETAIRTGEPVRLCVPAHAPGGDSFWIESTFQAIQADGTLRLVAASRRTIAPGDRRPWWRLASED